MTETPSPPPAQATMTPEGTRAPDEPGQASETHRKLASWRWEALRTTLWLVPTILVVVALVLFLITFAIDWAAYYGHLTLPFWMRTESADAGREVLIAIAAAVITVIGVVFSVTILAVTFASQQFGPRMMRNFVRDFGNQLTLGIFVGTFVYSTLGLGSITITGTHGVFVPHLSITVAEALLLVDIAVLIYFIHHIARSVQLPEVVAGIARDLTREVDAEFPEHGRLETRETPVISGRSFAEVTQLLDDRGGAVPAVASGYLQFVGYAQLVAIATRTDSVIRLTHRPGHFIAAGRPLATVWPRGAAQQVAQELAKAHVTGPHRTLMQDPVFAVDQLVEIAIRALSPAVNDTFTALTCIDWLSAGMRRISGRTLGEGIYRDAAGRVRLIEPAPSYGRMANRAFDKIRQSSRAMPVVMIHMTDALSSIMEETASADQRRVLLRQGEMIMRSAEDSVPEPNDLDDIRARYESLLAKAEALSAGPADPAAAP